MKTVIRNIHLIWGGIAAIGAVQFFLTESNWGVSLLLLAVFGMLFHAIRTKIQVGEFSKRYFLEYLSTQDVLNKAGFLINDLQLQLDHTVEAIKKIQEGSNESVTSVLDGKVGQAVQNLSTSLKSLKAQEDRQNWVVKGLAKLSEIRKSNAGLEDYTYQITSALVKYLDANQAVFYTMNPDESDPVLELKAAYAYGKRKYTDGKVTISIGSGLVGQSVLERELILMTEVPKDYVKITSGLGEATPTCIVIAPLIFREKVYGVIEIASFIVLETHHIEFIKKVSESIAAELADVFTQAKTTVLLKQSQEQAQELKSQEEELRQNMEEMQSTQEEMKRKEVQLIQNMQELNTAQSKMKDQEVELKMQLKQVLSERRKNLAILEGCVDGVVSFNETGNVQFFNSAAEEVFGFDRDEVIGESIQLFLKVVITGGGEEADGWRLLTNEGREITTRTEIETHNKSGDAISVLVTSTKVKLPDEILFTLFVQKISVDLF